jgi:predicted transcriptional regulator of viral defense system
MNYLSFEKAFREFPVFSIRDIKKRFPGIDSRRLFEWQKKGYLHKIRRGYYCFYENIRDEKFLFFTANKIYSPSYVSMESALAYYSFIPERVFVTTSITTRNTASYDTSIGEFSYSHFKSVLFFGYRLIQENRVVIKMAEPEKAILDYFYLNRLNSIVEIEEMRFNEIQVKENLDFQKLRKYQNIFDSRILDKRIRLFKKVINA